MTAIAPARTSSARLRVLVVHGSEAERQSLVDLLDADGSLQIVGSSSDWAQSMRSATQLKPDLIMMNLDTDRRGLEVIREIMREMPTPIVIVMRVPPERQRSLMAEVMNAGAVAIVHAPSEGGISSDTGRDLVSTVKNMAGVKVVRHWRGGRRSGGRAALSSPRLPKSAPHPALVAIGASTGGPPALRDLLSGLPESFPIPIVVVQHMADGFIGSMVEWLAPQCRLPIHVASAGSRLNSPAVHVAPSGHHLVIRRGALDLDDTPPVSGQRPSATVLFRSVVAAYGAKAAGVLLTGMGDDGAVGLSEMRRAGAVTIAQDEESSVVFGMPGAALRLDAASYSLPPPAIAALLLDLVRKGEGVR